MDNQEFLNRQKLKLLDKHVMMTTSDLEGNITDISTAYLEFMGYKKEEVLGENHRIFRNHDLDIKIIKDLWETILGDKTWNGEIKNNRKDGEPCWFKLTIEPFFNDKGKKVGYSAYFVDITDRKNTELLSITDPLTEVHNRRQFDITFNNEFKRAIQRGEYFGLLIIDVDHFKKYNDTYGHMLGDSALIEVSKVFRHVLGYDSDHVYRIGGEEFGILLLNRTNEQVISIATQIRNEVVQKEIPHESSTTSEFVTVSVGAINFLPQGDFYSLEAAFNLADINLYKAKEEGRNRVVFSPFTEDNNCCQNIDNKTKLPNRNVLLKDLNLINQESMLILIRINQYADIVDFYGDDVSDAVVAYKANELKKSVIDEEVTLYKLGSSEFGLLVSSKYLFEKYMSLMEYYILEEDECHLEKYPDISCLVVTYSIGIASGINDLLENADKALEKAIIGDKHFAVYSKNSEVRYMEREGLQCLRVYKDALNNGDLIPYFQGIYDSKTEELFKYEALARLRDKEGKIHAPATFLPVSKSDKSFEFFTRQILQKIFNIYGKNKNKVTINLTYENIISPTCVAYLKNRLEKFGGNGITIEIVESEDITDYKKVEKFILFVKEYGCQTAIDDFGSGYSNFTNIIKLNIDYIKLDGSLIENVNIDKNVETMVKALVQFAKETKIKTVAEFVSTKEIAEKVKTLGIDYLQGYYYSEPKSPEELGFKI
ncbi:MAG: diguanylate cyclase [Campylobacterales bacterium]|nr:diguanylate cyclase [Campylobacterales bacterium]